MAASAPTPQMPMKRSRMTPGMKAAATGVCPPGTYLREGYRRSGSRVVSPVSGEYSRAPAEVRPTCAKLPRKNAWREFLRKKIEEERAKGIKLNARDAAIKFSPLYQKMKAELEARKAASPRISKRASQRTRYEEEEEE